MPTALHKASGRETRLPDLKLTESLEIDLAVD
jgi:hypothetical protein